MSEVDAITFDPARHMPNLGSPFGFSIRPKNLREAEQAVELRREAATKKRRMAAIAVMAEPPTESEIARWTALEADDPEIFEHEGEEREIEMPAATNEGDKASSLKPVNKRQSEPHSLTDLGPATTEDKGGVKLDDFRAFMPMHSYIFAPSCEMWPAASVNARIPPVVLTDRAGNPKLDKKGEEILLPANAWLDRHRSVEQMTWAPGLPMLVRDRLISDGGWIARQKVTCFNLYRPPTITHGDPDKATRWLDHINKIYGADGAHIINWLAHRVQKPGEKINHALVLGGLQGIGKDTLLEPAKLAVGPWNFVEVSPQHLLGRFNGFVKSVILRVSEARDLGDVDRFAFYDHMKTYTAAPPDVLRCDEKNLREYAVFNVCGVIITTNHKSDGLYLPADDRRHYVAWSEKKAADFSTDYWTRLYGWYRNGGDRHVAAFLAGHDLGGFDAKAPPPKTAAFWEIVDANRAPEDAELADALDELNNPDATTLNRIAARATGDLGTWLKDRKNRRMIPHRLEEVGYVTVRNATAADGLWKIGDKRQVIYARKSLSVHDRFAAANELFEQSR